MHNTVTTYYGDVGACLLIKIRCVGSKTTLFGFLSVLCKINAFTYVLHAGASRLARIVHA